MTADETQLDETQLVEDGAGDQLERIQKECKKFRLKTSQLKAQAAQEILTSFDRAFTTHFLTKKTMSKASQHNIFKDVLDQLEFLKDNALMMRLAEKPARKESECKFCCVPRKGHLCPIKVV